MKKWMMWGKQIPHLVIDKLVLPQRRENVYKVGGRARLHGSSGDAYV